MDAPAQTPAGFWPALDPDPDPDAIGTLARVPPALGPRLDLLLRTGRDMDALSALARAAAALGPRLAPEQVSALAPILDRSRVEEDLPARAALVWAAAPLILLLEGDSREATLSLAQNSLAYSQNESEAEAWAGAIAALLANEGDEGFASGIVAVLRHPIAAGEPTDLLLKTLATRFAQAAELKTGRLEDALAWFAATYP
jgi:hypothetical protein